MANLPIVNAGEKYINGLRTVWLTTNQITVEDGQCRDSSNENDIVLDASVTLNPTNNGANGLDTGSLANNTFYAIYLIGDSTGYQSAASICSADTSSPLLPAGYDMYRHIGWFLSSGAAAVLKFWTYGEGSYRQFWYDVAISELSAGSATSFTTIDCASSIPLANCLGRFDILFTPDGATDVAEFRPTGSTASVGQVRFGYGVAGAQVGQVEIPLYTSGATKVIQYKVTSGDTIDVKTAGFDFYV